MKTRHAYNIKATNGYSDIYKVKPMHKVAFFAIVFIFSLTAMLFHVVAVNPAINKTIYHMVMLPACLWPVFMLNHKNSRYSLLIVFSGYYYLAFGLFDFFTFSIWELGLIDSFSVGVDRSLMLTYSSHTSLSEIVIIFGIIFFQLGYFLKGTKNKRVSNAEFANRDWKYIVILSLAFIFSLGGLVANSLVWIFNVTEKETSLISVIVANLSYFGMISTTMFVYLIYVGYARKKTAMIFFIIVCLQGLIGLAAGSKEFVLQPIFLLLVGYYLFYRTVSVKAVLLIICFSLTFMAIYPFMYQSRNVSEHKGLDGIERLESYSKSSEIVSKKKVFLQGLVLTTNRVNAKGSIDTVVYGTENGAPFQYGRTIKLLFYSFIPSIVWSNRPDISIGREVNEAFNVSSTKDTYISLTYLGEMYWNFGIFGAIIGMVFYGILLSFINARCSLNTYPYLLNFIILSITTYHLIFRFEGGIGTKVHYVRTIIIIVLISFIIKKIGLFRKVAK